MTRRNGTDPGAQRPLFAPLSKGERTKAAIDAEDLTGGGRPPRRKRRSWWEKLLVALLPGALAATAVAAGVNASRNGSTLDKHDARLGDVVERVKALEVESEHVAEAIQRIDRFITESIEHDLKAAQEENARLRNQLTTKGTDR